MGRKYTHTLKQSITTGYDDADMFFLDSTKPFALHEIGISALQDEYNPQLEYDEAAIPLRLQLLRGHTTYPNTYYQTNHEPILLGDNAPTTVSGIRGTPPVSSGGTATALYSWWWSYRQPFRHIFQPQYRPIQMPGSNILCLRFTWLPYGDATMDYSWYHIYEELT